MKLFLGNKNYSSWSLRGWLACKQSGLAFEEIIIPMYRDDWDNRRDKQELQPSYGRVPTLWDGDAVIWDSMAIIGWLADKTHRDRFWPKDEAACGMARSMAAEMHSSYPNLRKECPMNIRANCTDKPISEGTREDTIRILQLWAEARARFGKGGPFLFGSFGAVDIMFAPVVTRFKTYGFKLPGFAQAYSEAIFEQSWMAEWVDASHNEPWTIEQYDKMAGQ